jgi:hypothetical protein
MKASIRHYVAIRAAGGCDYCIVPEAFGLTPFQIEHVVAKQHRGGDQADNLAFACLRCNVHKRPNLTGIDPKTSKITRLFNPRRQAWSRHFRWRGAVLVGRTAIGRTTVALLAINDPARLTLRRELMEQGLF